MIHNKTLLSAGDFIDLFYKIKEKGYSALLSKFHISNKSRTLSKWNTVTPSSDFWIIPELLLRWNEKCTGNPAQGYEDYFVARYLQGKMGLRMLSVGCGSGSQERKFGKYPNFGLIRGIDLAGNKIETARQMALDLNLTNLDYQVGDFEHLMSEKSAWDIILFHSSLHHFKHIDRLLQSKVMPLLKPGGFLVIFEYTGPSRLQWTREQLKFSNAILKEIPEKYKIRVNSNSVKKRIYRPGLLRMMFVDPSEAADSESIIPSIHKYFKTLEEKKVGWNITHLLFKDIAHNFLHPGQETKSLLRYIFDKEDEFLSARNSSDCVFGVYQNVSSV